MLQNDQSNQVIETDHQILELNAMEYNRGMGAFRPHFQGISENYYPLTPKEIFLSFLILISVIGIALGIMIGFIFWATINLQNYVIVWISIFLGFMCLCIGLFYWGGKNRQKMEKKLIKESNRKNQQMMNNKR